MFNPWFFRLSNSPSRLGAQSAVILKLNANVRRECFRSQRGTFDKGERHRVSKVQNAPTPVEQRSIEGGVPQAVTGIRRSTKRRCLRTACGEGAKGGDNRYLSGYAGRPHEVEPTRGTICQVSALPSWVWRAWQLGAAYMLLPAHICYYRL